MIGSDFDAQSTAAEVVVGRDLRKVAAIVTGGGGGLGLETAKILASAGADVTIAVRDVAAARKVLQLQADSGEFESVKVMTLDLGDFASVRAFAAQWGDRPLNLLINNAGVMGGPLRHTVDGLEANVGINHFGHFLLTGLLLRNLEQSAPSRVVVLTSGAHRSWPFDFDDYNFERQPYDAQAAYGRSKSANNLFMVGLTARMGKRGITANAVMPGVIQTGLMRHLGEEQERQLFLRLQSLVRTPAQGAATSVWAATAPALADMGGLYLENCAQAPLAEPDGRTGVAAHSIDLDRAGRLWRLSEAVTGLLPSLR